jgi:hypothetical protein
MWFARQRVLDKTLKWITVIGSMGCGKPIIAALLLISSVSLSNPAFGMGYSSATSAGIPADPPSNSLLQVIVQTPEVVVVGQVVPINVYTLYNGSLTVPAAEQFPCAIFPCLQFGIFSQGTLMIPNVHTPLGIDPMLVPVKWDRPGEWNTSYNLGSLSRQLPGLYTVQIPVNYTLAPSVSVINQGIASFFAQPAPPAQPTPASASDLAALASAVGTVQTITYGILGVLVLVLVLELLASRKKTRQST